MPQRHSVLGLRGLPVQFIPKVRYSNIDDFAVALYGRCAVTKPECLSKQIKTIGSNVLRLLDFQHRVHTLARFRLGDPRGRRRLSMKSA